MPIYTYRCNECRHEFEELIFSAAAEAVLVCPQCKAASVERRLAAFATVRGTGSAAGCSAPAGCNAPAGST